MRLLLLILAALITGCSSYTTKQKLEPLKVAETVDVERYLGRWYVIANIPYSAENGKVGSYVEYLKRDDGRMDDLYFFRKQNFDRKLQRWEGVAWIPDPAQPTRWKAQFVWPLTFDYLILEVAPDYSWAMVGHPGRDLAWIFARTPTLDDALYQQLLVKFTALNYDASRLQRVPQFPDDLGKPGFQTPK